MLQITNGDCAGEVLRHTGLPGEILLWRDVLHEGPVPTGLSLEQLRPIRAQYIADQGWGSYDEVVKTFAHRDALLSQFPEHEAVLLWFEHDLYDQLQIIQVLDWFAQRDLGKTNLSLICINAFPGVDQFKGLGQLNADQLASLYGSQRQIAGAELSLSREAWSAFRSPDPTALETLLARDSSALPFLGAALGRHLEQFPGLSDGLSRTERQILQGVAAGAHTPVEIFRADQCQETVLFMGDTDVWSHLQRLCVGRAPLLRLTDGGPFLPWRLHNREPFLAQSLSLSEAGHEVLAGRADWLHLNGIDRWLGGVHLHSPGLLWRWDPQNRKLVQDPSL